MSDTLEDDGRLIVHGGKPRAIDLQIGGLPLGAGERPFAVAEMGEDVEMIACREVQQIAQGIRRVVFAQQVVDELAAFQGFHPEATKILHGGSLAENPLDHGLAVFFQGDHDVAAFPVLEDEATLGMDEDFFTALHFR